MNRGTYVIADALREAHPGPVGAERRSARRIVLVAFPGVEVLDVTGPLSVLNAANRLSRRAEPYSCEVVAVQAAPVETSSGLALVAQRALARVRGPVDTVIVPGGPGTEHAVRDAKLLSFLRRVAPRARRIASVCSGTFVLATAGLLAGRRVTTHWAVAAELAHRFPDLHVDADAIWVRDGRVYTSAGVTSGIDLALALVEEDCGKDLAMAVARQLVVFLKRPGGQSQFSEGLRAQADAVGPLAGLPAWIAEHLRDDLTIPELARRVALSPRHFARVFTETFGVTPAKYVEQVRVERARICLEELALSIDEVADTVGFENAERMRRTFLRHLRVVPQEYRRRFRPQLRESA